MSEHTNEGPKNVIDHAKSPTPIDGALTDLHNNLGDTAQLLNDLEAKIFPGLGPELTHPGESQLDVGSSESFNSRIHDVIRDQDALVVELQERIRSLIRRVEL